MGPKRKPEHDSKRDHTSRSVAPRPASVTSPRKRAASVTSPRNRPVSGSRSTAQSPVRAPANRKRPNSAISKSPPRAVKKRSSADHKASPVSATRANHGYNLRPRRPISNIHLNQPPAEWEKNMVGMKTGSDMLWLDESDDSDYSPSTESTEEED